MLHKDNPQENIQALRSVDKNIHPNAIPLATPEEIYHVETQVDPDTQKDIVLWDDILQAFENAVQVRHKTKMVPFLKGKDLRILEPRRIAAVPNIVLDVVVDTPVTDNVGVASPQVRQLELQPVLPQDGSTIKAEDASQDAISTPITTTATPTPIATSSSSALSNATSAVRRNPVYGLVETAMENYTHIDRPLVFPSARGPHAVQDDQTGAVKDHPAPSHPNSDNKSVQRAPQSVTANLSVEIQWAQVIVSASQGDKDAQVALGDMYRDGKGVAQDYHAAMDWYLKAVEQGHAAGQQRVGGLYDEGLGVPQNYSTAMNWYLKAAEQGHAGSQYSIGELYYSGHGVPQDYAQAMDWYLKAANQGDASAQHSIGYIYNHGHGVPQDYALAMEWYLKAANQGESLAQYNIGTLYLHGRGVPQDYTMAAKWFQKAADQGNANAKLALTFFNWTRLLRR